MSRDKKFYSKFQSNLATFVHKNGQAQSLLDAFCRHQAHINPGTDLTDAGHWDHGVLLTGYVNIFIECIRLFRK